MFAVVAVVIVVGEGLFGDVRPTPGTVVGAMRLDVVSILRVCCPLLLLNLSHAVGRVACAHGGASAGRGAPVYLTRAGLSAFCLRWVKENTHGKLGVSRGDGQAHEDNAQWLKKRCVHARVGWRGNV